MHKFFIQENNIIGNEGKIIGDDVKHIIKVLRLNIGEKVIINNCNGEEYLSEITDTSKTEVNVSIIEKLDINNESTLDIVLFQGMPKAQKMDFIVQKGTELGLKEIVPVVTKRVDVKLKGEFKKIDRLNRIALEASKQSKRTIIPRVKSPIEFDELLKEISQFDLFVVPYENAEKYGLKTYIADNSEKLNEIKKIGIMIGPEGGFEEEEINMLEESNAKIITLGNRILRTETAGFVMTSLLQYELGDLGGNLK